MLSLLINDKSSSNNHSITNAEIEEANWLTLDEDIELPADGQGFDALICMGNSFAHLPDFHGDQRDHLRAISNFYGLIKPGGILVIDHRNYDGILDQGQAPKNNIYYNVRLAVTNWSLRRFDFLTFVLRIQQSKFIKDIKTSVLYVDGKSHLITLDYEIDVSSMGTRGMDEESG